MAQAPNPLMPAPPPARAPAQPAPHAMSMHAKVFGHVQSLPADGLPERIARTEYALPILGALMTKDDVKGRDVARALADAVAAKKVPADQAMKLLSAMPTGEGELRPWLKGMYAINLSAVVHMKAALLAARQGGAAPGMSAPAAPASVPGAAP